MVFGIFRISGHSMMPYLKPYDRVIVSSIPYYFSKPKIGDVVLFRYNDKMLIKRIKKFSSKSIFVKGDNVRDSLKTKPIKRDAILGKLILILNA